MASKTSFSCGDALDIANAASLQTRFEKSLQKSSTIELKADAVEKVDTAGLQLIIAVQKEALASGGKIIWKNPSQKLIASAKSLGLHQHLGLSK